VRPLICAVLLSLATVALAAPVYAATPEVTEFSSGITTTGSIVGIAMGPDGNMWFTEWAANAIGRITPAGVVTEFPLPNGSQPFGIAGGHDGTLWFTESGTDKIGHITTAGDLLPEITLATDAYPIGIAADASDGIWVTESGLSRIARWSTSAGTLSEQAAGITANASPWGITPGPDFAMWFTETNADKVGRHGLTSATSVEQAGASGTDMAAGPDGMLWYVKPGQNEVASASVDGGQSIRGLPTQASAPTDIAPGPDGRMWVTEQNGNKVARLEPGSVPQEFGAGISANALPAAIAAGPDGAMWFTESSGRIARITTGDNPFAFTAPGPITLPQNHGVGSPYPSTLDVSGLQGTVKRVRVRLNGLFAQSPEEVKALLVDPGGRAVELFGRIGSGADAAGAVMTFADDGITPVQLTSGNYVPSHADAAGSLEPPAPAGPYSTSLSTLNGVSPNGQWSLYLRRGSSTGSTDVLAAGWSLDIQTVPPQTIEVPGPTQIVPGPTNTIPAAADQRRAKLRVAGVPKQMTLAKFLKGFRMTLTPDEPAGFDVSLTGTTKKATLARAGVALFHKTLGRADGVRTLKVKPLRSAVGKPRKAVKVKLRIVATDRGGNLTVASRTIKVTPKKR
jgi:virginiamycin B lyase